MRLSGCLSTENVDKSYWDQVKPSTYEQLAVLAKTADPTSISQAQYVILMEAVVREVRRCEKVHRMSWCSGGCGAAETVDPSPILPALAQGQRSPTTSG